MQGSPADHPFHQLPRPQQLQPPLQLVQVSGGSGDGAAKAPVAVTCAGGADGGLLPRSWTQELFTADFGSFRLRRGTPACVAVMRPFTDRWEAVPWDRPAHVDAVVVDCTAVPNRRYSVIFSRGGHWGTLLVSNGARVQPLSVCRQPLKTQHYEV